MIFELQAPARREIPLDEREARAMLARVSLVDQDAIRDRRKRRRALAVRGENIDALMRHKYPETR